MQAYADPYDRDDALIERHLGTRYLGRRYISFAELIALGVVDNRATLTLWVEAGVFPRPIKLAGPTGKSLRWVAIEIAQLIATRCAERDEAPTANKKGVPAQGRPHHSRSPLATGRTATSPCEIPTTGP